MDGDDGGGAQGGDVQMKSQGDAEDPAGQGRGGNLEDCGGAIATKDEGRAGGKEELDRAVGAE